MSQQNVELVRALVPTPDTDVASLFRDERIFEATREALASFFDPGFESVAVWQGGGTTYTGVEGFREMWLDWLEPWATYHVHVDEVIDAGDRVVVLVRDRARRHDVDAEVELISGSVWEVRDARIVRVEFCGDRAEALETAGLRE
jgi:SnoaL-like protein